MDGDVSRTVGGPRLPDQARGIVGWILTGSDSVVGCLRRVAKRILRWNRFVLLDPWLRYSPVESILRRTPDLGSLRVLDVGCGNAGLACFSRVPTVGVDVQFLDAGFVAAAAAQMRRVKASATQLPFRDAAFDAVVSMDMLEHVPREVRSAAVRELFRVGRKIVIVGFPFGKSSEEFDRYALAVEHSRGMSTGWREEHVTNGLPGEEEHATILAIANSLHPRAQVSWHGHEGALGLRVRWKLQFLIPRESRLHGPVFYPIYWLHRLGRRRNAYRRIYTARL